MNMNIGWLLCKGWSVYPQQRPIEGVNVKVAVLDLGGRFLNMGKGYSKESKYCGVCIVVNGITLDSNGTFLWKVDQSPCN